MAGVAGKSGTVTVDGSTKLLVTTWGFSPSAEATETSGMSDGGYRTYVEGLVGATISISANWDDTGATGEPPELPRGGSVTFTLITDTGAEKTYTGSMVVTTAPAEVVNDGLVTYSIEGTVTGAWVEA